MLVGRCVVVGGIRFGGVDAFVLIRGNSQLAVRDRWAPIPEIPRRTFFFWPVSRQFASAYPERWPVVKVAVCASLSSIVGIASSKSCVALSM